MPDVSGLGKQLRYDLSRWREQPSLTADLLRAAYREACVSRMHVERVVQECLKGTFKFATWGPGEEVFATAAAIALHQEVDPAAFGICGHYRSGTLLAMWARLLGHNDFYLNHMRQQMSRATDPWSGGRQMTAHYNDPSLNHLPVQSALGMQIGKSVGYAEGLKRKGVKDGLVFTVIGDGTCAESDLHEGMTGAAILELPWLLVVTDNNIAISVTPKDGRAIRDFAAYAQAFGFLFDTCDGNDFVESYAAIKAAARTCRTEQRPGLVWVRNLSRLNDHSSAADVTFKFDQYDPLLEFGAALVDEGVLAPEDIVRRKEGASKDYFARHDLGRVGQEADDYVRWTMEMAASEPEPTYETVLEHVRDPFPPAQEPPATGRPTAISINGALRAALRGILRSNPMTWLYGQDVGAKGGVMQATRGLHQEFPDQVRDSPINEPLIVGSAMGFALHPGATALPEIQFSDYSLNTLHWLVHLGNLLWSSNGTLHANVILRLPVEPLHGGALYHSMCMEGFYASVPGLTICAPSTSRDVYGLLRSAADYTGPVLFFESKGLYRLPLGDAFPGEPEAPEDIAALKRAIAFEGEAPTLPDDFRVPLGKAALRRSGTDLTIVTWGRCTIFCGQAAQELAAEGIECEVIDLRTIVPPDLDAVVASVRKTKRLLVVHEDRVFSSLGRELQGSVVESLASEPIASFVLGQDPVPGIPQNIKLEEQVVVSPRKVCDAVRRLLVQKLGAPPCRAEARRSAAPILWKPNRHFVA